MKKRTLICCIASIFGAAQSIAAPPEFIHPLTAIAPPSKPLRAFGDDRDWILLEKLEYRIGNTVDIIAIPAGFVTDLASIPKQFWGPPLYLTPTGQYGRAAIIHDYLYWSQKCTREQADRLLVIAMKESGVSAVDEWAIYNGLQVGGKRGWKQDAEENRKGFPRVLPDDRREPSDPNMNWPTYREQLMADGVTGLTVNDDGHYCHYGDSMDIPHRL